jgi:hypothetical protein
MDKKLKNKKGKRIAKAKSKTMPNNDSESNYREAVKRG